MATWNHSVRAATTEERKSRSDRGALCAITFRCAWPVEFFLGYDHITGRADGTGHRETGACHFHAKQFGAKHGLTMPDAEVIS